MRSCPGLLLALALALAAEAAAPLCDLAQCGPLNVSASGRFLATRQGRPFYYVADTPWHLLQDVSLPEATEFIDARLSQGFTALQLNALGLGDDPNAQGDWFGNWTNLNEDYWAHVDAVLLYMQRKGMAAYVVPVWTYNWACGVARVPHCATLVDHFTFGKLLGARWKAFGNVLWVLGGDTHRPPVDKWRQLLAGIRAGGAQQLVSAHASAPGSSSALMPNELSFYSVQNRAGRTGGGGTPAGTTGSLVLHDVISQRRTPTLMAETWYESAVDGGLYNLHYRRGPLLREAYWGARLAGSLGDAYGEWGGWCSSGLSPPHDASCGAKNATPGWKSDLTLNGAGDISGVMKKILMTVEWSQLTLDGYPDRCVFPAAGGNTTTARLYVAHTDAGAGTDAAVVVYAFLA